MLCALAGAVKAPALIGVVAIVWTYGGAEISTRLRAMVVAKSVLISVATFEAMSLLFGIGWGWTRTLGATADVTNWLTPTDLVAIATSHLAGVLHVQRSVASLLGPAHALGLLAAVAIVLWAFWRLPRLGMPRTLGICYLAIVLLGPTVQPWYLAWGIVFLALADDARSSSTIVALTVATSILGVVGLNLLKNELVSLGPILLLLLSVGVVASVIAPVEVSPGRKGEVLLPRLPDPEVVDA